MSDVKTIVLPDGCRDLIMHVPKGQSPRWFISPLQDRTKTVPVRAGDVMRGFRLKPGARIDEARLLNSVRGRMFGPDEIHDRIDQYCAVSDRTGEALDGLAARVTSVAQAARRLGVSDRSLQRLVMSQTGRPPSFWLMLARVRNAARALSRISPPARVSLAEHADAHGFSDQAHMCREFRRWLDISPSALSCGGERIRQLRNPGYG